MILDKDLLPNIVYLSEIDSTNEYAKKIYKNSDYQYKVIITDNQYDGKGTKGRVWLSTPYKNGTFSITIKTSKRVELLDNLSVIVADKISKYLKDRFQIDTYIKGQNDIYCGEKKLVGILIETLVNDNKIKHLLIGVGINVNQDIFEDSLNNSATSIKLEVGEEVDIENIINDICMLIIKIKEIRVFIDEK